MNEVRSPRPVFEPPVPAAPELPHVAESRPVEHYGGLSSYRSMRVNRIGRELFEDARIARGFEIEREIDQWDLDQLGFPLVPAELRGPLEASVDAELRIEEFFLSKGFPRYSVIDYLGWRMSAEMADEPLPLPEIMHGLSHLELDYLEGLDREREAAMLQAEIIAEEIYGPTPLPVDPQKRAQIPTVSTRLEGSPRVERAVSEALERWQERGYDPPCGGDIELWGSNRLSSPKAAAVAPLSPELSEPCYIEYRIDEIKGSSDERLTTITEHEIGHNLGFCHSPQKDSIMYSNSESPGECEAPHSSWTVERK
ncbi:MAG: matrixin family metalloprotease [Patescibacteria group bacterium]